MGNNPSYFASTGDGEKNVGGQSTEGHPVESVSWLDAIRYCNALSKKERLTPYYGIEGERVTVRDIKGSGFRLPTEAEWEYACRAGSTTKYSFGDDPRKLGEYGWYNENSDGKTHIVGQKRRSDFGLYDMHGNVAEWCWDGGDVYHYAQSAVVNPQGPAEASQRVIRGEGWSSSPRGCRSAFRFRDAPDVRNCYLGFRVARGQSAR